MATQLKIVGDAAKIDKAVPLPPRRGAKKYPFAEMEIGDSFFIPADGAQVYALGGFVRVLAHRQRPKQFTTRKVEGGLRCWRTA